MLRSLANGKYNSPHCTDSKLQRIAGTKCSVLCSKGFKASQSGVSWVCDKDGEWSNKATQITCNGENQCTNYSLWNCICFSLKHEYHPLDELLAATAYTDAHSPCKASILQYINISVPYYEINLLYLKSFFPIKEIGKILIFAVPFNHECIFSIVLLFFSI